MRTPSFLLALLVTLPAAHGYSAEVRGVVVRADTEKKELQLDLRGLGRRGQVMTFAVTDATQFQLGRDAARLADLTAGKRVRVVYEIRGGRPVALLVSGFALNLNLNGSPVPPPAPSPPASATPGSGGELRRVALTDREIVVVGGQDGEMTYQVPEDARILRDGKAIPFEELKEGEAVTVQGERRGGKVVAKEIQVGTAVAPAAPPDTRLQRLRGLLKMVDQLLEMAEQKR